MIRLPTTSISLSERDLQHHLAQVAIYEELLKQGFKKDDIIAYLQDQRQTSRRQYQPRRSSLLRFSQPVSTGSEDQTYNSQPSLNNERDDDEQESETPQYHLPEHTSDTSDGESIQIHASPAYPLDETAEFLSHLTIESPRSLSPTSSVQFDKSENAASDISPLDLLQLPNSSYPPAVETEAGAAHRTYNVCPLQTRITGEELSHDGILEDDTQLPSITTSVNIATLADRVGDFTLDRLPQTEPRKVQKRTDVLALQIYNDLQPSSSQPQTPGDLSRQRILSHFDANYTAPPGAVRNSLLTASTRLDQPHEQYYAERSPTLRAIEMRERRSRELRRGVRVDGIRMARLRDRSTPAHPATRGVDGAFDQRVDFPLPGHETEDLHQWHDELNGDRIGDENFELETGTTRREIRVVSGNAQRGW